jgi:hypothetical protein
MYALLKIITIVAIALLSTRSVYSQLAGSIGGYHPGEQMGATRFFELDAANLDLSIGADAALSLISYLCSQPQDGIHGDRVVSGAYNIVTHDFLTWADYRSTVGADNDINTFYAAKHPWETFWGKCTGKPQYAWFERGPTTFGLPYRNLQNSDGTRHVKIAVDIPAFAGYTTIRPWEPDAKSPELMKIFFTNLGLPADMIWGWTGLQRMELAVEECSLSLRFLRRTEKQLMASTVFQTVRAVPVFQVHQYNWNREDSQGTADSWRDLGDAWKSVYSSSGYIEGKGIHVQLPDLSSYFTLNVIQRDLPPWPPVQSV